MEWLLWRVVKFIGLAILGAGLGLSLFAPPEARLRAACWWTGGGLMLTWCSGYGLVQSGSHPLLSLFVLTGVGLSLLAHGGALLSALRPGRLAGALTVGGLFGAVAVMVLKPPTPDQLGPTVVIGLLGAVLGGLLRPSEEPLAEEASTVVTEWFIWIARLEGVSLLALFFVVMPLKHGAGITEGGWAGWIHGALFMQYGLALAAAARLGGWGTLRIVGAVVAALLPFGTLVFERRMRRWGGSVY